MRHLWAIPTLLICMSALQADGPADNVATQVRPIPPKGQVIPDADRTELEVGTARLGKEIESLKSSLKGKMLELLPDVQIYHNAVRYALVYDEFLNEKGLASEVKAAKAHLKAGFERAAALRDGKAPWTTATGNIVRGYVSKIDGSVQPYGLVVPPTYKPDLPHRYRLDIWCHGRGEILNEVSFLQQRSAIAGEFTPANTLVLHPYGRYCNANKFAGEIDVLEAMEHVKKNYAIDENRVVMRGFSMGGAACWQFAVHYPSLWCAAAPGAGFSETPEFLRVFQKEDVSKAPAHEKKLFRLYDCTGYAANLFNCPTVAYSGEDDSQKQAADIMAATLKAKHGMELTHIIGPKTKHAYEAKAKVEINRRIDLLAAKGRPSVPPQVKFTTFTLRYNESYWIRIDKLEHHWEEASIVAEIDGKDKLKVQTSNVREFTVQFPPGGNPFAGKPIFYFDNDPSGIFLQAKPQSDGSLTATFRKVAVEKGNINWKELVGEKPESGPHKVPGLQGPIDDAFMDRFIFVRPTGKGMSEKTAAWVDREMKHAIEHWRKHFRGDAIVKDDKDITELDALESNLVLWGDAKSNSVIAEVLPKLPIAWTEKELRIGESSFSAEDHMPVLIYPNPKSPNKYVVLNSGFTFREYDYLNNARQVPKLPDFAIIDVKIPPNPRYPGRIALADFFDEQWRVAGKK